MTTRTGGRRPLRTSIAAMLAAVGLLALAGCMKVDMDMTLSEDDTVSGTVVMAVSNSFAETLGMEPGELWQQGQGELGSSAPEGATEEPYSDDEYTGTQYTFTDTPISEIGGADDGQMSITRDGDEYVVSGSMDLTEGTEQLDQMPEGVRDAFDVQISVTFPGPVGETNGTVDGNTVTWTPAIGETTELQARGAAEAGSSFPWWIVGLVVGLVVIALVVWFVVRNNRKTPGATTGTAADSAFAAETTPGEVPAPGTRPTPEEQVFGAPDAPTTGPVAEPFEPTPDAPAPAPAPPASPATGPVPEPLEPPAPDTQRPDTQRPGTDLPDTDLPDTQRRPTDPPQGV